MTPKEKANELVDKLKLYMYCYSGSGMLTNSFDKNVQLDFAKQCAIIAVDEILFNVEIASKEVYDYWQQVRKEIANL